MILQELSSYYAKLVERGDVPKYGWSPVKVSYAAEIDEEGNLLRIQLLKEEAQRGKKTSVVPRELVLPAPVKKTSGKKSNFLYENGSYLFGLDRVDKAKKKAQTDNDAEENAGNGLESFNTAKELHLKLLNDLDDPTAKAICNFFNKWDVSVASANEKIQPFIDDLVGSNITFLVGATYVSEIQAIENAWDHHFQNEGESNSHLMVDIVMGNPAVPQNIHPSIKGIPGALSSGAALISFNAPADWSYGREQNLNAPMSKYSAFAYTSALNYLLAKRDGQGKTRFAKMIGDTTLVFWSEDADDRYQDVLTDLLDGGTEQLTNEDLRSIVTDLCSGNPVDWDKAKMHPDNRFYLLGLSPNTARISVRSSYSNTFGSITDNIEHHYERLTIVKPKNENRQVLPLWELIRETGNQNSQNKNPSPQLSDDILQAIVSDSVYPATLYQQIELRIRSDRNVNWRRAAIIKAYFMKNLSGEINKEVLTVNLNETTTYQPYVLGRLFSLLEEIQNAANPGINTTIKDKYFTSACATPAVVFPILLGLSEKHLKKLDGGKKIYYSQRMQQLVSMITETYPVHMTLYEQGIFQLGYYHQTQKRYEKKVEEKSNV